MALYVDLVSKDRPKTATAYPRTPDGRYFVVRDRLWRLSNPALSQEDRDRLVHQLMQARRALRSAKGEARREVRARIDAAKRGLGERGAVWWSDGAADYNRSLVKNTPYREWWEQTQHASGLKRPISRR